MTLYTDIRRRLHQATGDAKYSLDQEECTAFIMSTNKRAAVTVSPISVYMRHCFPCVSSPFVQLERLDADLKNYRHNSIKESIRRGYDALGDHYLDCGDLKSVTLFN